MSSIVRRVHFFAFPVIDSVGLSDRWVSSNGKKKHNGLRIIILVHSLTDLLMKDANNLDPGRVINISSVNSVEANAEGPLSGEGRGTWSCEYYLTFSALTYFIPHRQPQQGGRHVRKALVSFIVVTLLPVNHLTTVLSAKLGPRHITCVPHCITFLVLMADCSVNAICPGYFQRALSSSPFFDLLPVSFQVK